MILFEFGLSKPAIKKYQNEFHTTLVVNLGLFKMTWLSESLTQLFLKVVSLGLQDIELLSNYKEKEALLINSYEMKLEELQEINVALEKSIDELSMTNEGLKFDFVQLNDQLTMDRKLLETYVQENVSTKHKKGRKNRPNSNYINSFTKIGTCSVAVPCINLYLI